MRLHWQSPWRPVFATWPNVDSCSAEQDVDKIFRAFPPFHSLRFALLHYATADTTRESEGDQVPIEIGSRYIHDFCRRTLERKLAPVTGVTSVNIVTHIRGRYRVPAPRRDYRAAGPAIQCGAVVPGASAVTSNAQAGPSGAQACSFERQASAIHHLSITPASTARR